MAPSRKGSTPRIDYLVLDDLMRMDVPQKKIAEHFGVTQAAVSKAMKVLKTRTAAHLGAGPKRCPAVVDKNINSLQQLQKINTYANEMLDLLMRWGKGDPEAYRVLESNVDQEIMFGPPGSESKVLLSGNIRMKDPRELAVKVMGEIRAQLDLQLKLFQTLYDMQAVQEFQTEVIRIIGEIEPNARRRIIKRLHQRRALFQDVHPLGDSQS
jgi:predicted transcriptional regulator